MIKEFKQELNQAAKDFKKESKRNTVISTNFNTIKKRNSNNKSELLELLDYVEEFLKLLKGDGVDMNYSLIIDQIKTHRRNLDNKTFSFGKKKTIKLNTEYINKTYDLFDDLIRELQKSDLNKVNQVRQEQVEDLQKENRELKEELEDYRVMFEKMNKLSS